MKIVKEGFRSIKFFAFWAIGFYILGVYFQWSFFQFLGILSFIFTIFSLYFFRNPDRKILATDNEIVSPADGVILDISEEYNEILGSNCKVIRIFLSVFNVHVQRAPIEGKIKYIEYKNGKFLSAMHPKAHLENEQNLVLFENEKTSKRILCSQIAGLIARNIVMWKKEGDILNMGELYGMIKFGSQVDIYIPDSVSVNVSIKQKVVAGETILANWVS